MYIRVFFILFIILLSYLVPAQSKSSYYFRAVSSYKVTDIEQPRNVVINPADKPLSLFVFLSPECPLCRNYTKTLNEIYEKYNQKVNLYGIVPGSAYTVKDVSDFKNKYNVSFRLFIDEKQKLTHYLQADVTPQVVLLNNNGYLIYTGAIDDWVQGLGKKRLQISQHYVLDAIKQSLQPEIVKVQKTTAIGCKINDY